MAGPLSFEDINGDHTLSVYDSDVVLRYNTSGQLIVPNDADGNFPRGMQVAVESLSGTVRIVGANGVEIKGADRLAVGPLRTGVMVKENANFWLLGLGSSGGGGGSAPTAPKNVKAFGSATSIIVTWQTPDDDGGHTITSYIVEYGTDQSKLDQKQIVDGDTFSLQIPNLTKGTTYYAWVKAANSVGISDPSSVVNAVPTSDYNDASGGVVTEYEKNGRFFRVHTFADNGTFTVAKATNPFRVLCVGGGGGGGGTNSPQGGGGGAGGVVVDQQTPLPVGQSTVVVGGGGAGGNDRDYGGGGGPSTIDKVSAGGGNGGAESGGTGGAGQPAYGGTSSDISGTAVQCGQNGGASGNQQGGGNGGFPGGGGSGAIGGFGIGRGANGQKGIVVVSYEIAPYNDAVGGEIADVDNYNGTGQKWRVHTFKNSSDLIVKSASKPFRVLCVAGGAGGAGGGPYYGGGGGGGAGGLIFKEEQALAVGTYPVTIGQGGNGGEGAREGAHNGVAGSPGGASSIAGLQAVGGGGGGAYQSEGQSGGSGGGGYSGRGGYAGTPGQGNDGGPGGNPGGGTGGGAGASGGGGGGGKPVNITGADVTYASGAGCVDSGAGSGAANTGNGGQGTRGGSPQYGGNGGSGVVIVAYQIG